MVQPANIVLTGVGDVDAGGNWTPQIDLGVQLDAGFGTAEVGPRKQRQRQIDSRRVQRVDCVLQFQAQIFSGIERSGLAHEALSQVLPQPPIPLFVGIGQGRFGHRFGKAQMIEGLRLGIQTSGDIPQSLAPGELGEGHANELLATPEMADPRLGIVTLDQAVEGLPTYKVEHLRQDVAARIHGPKVCSRGLPTSNASHPSSCASRSETESNKQSLDS